MKQADHEKYMSLALKQAEKAYALGEVPIGAVVVDEHGEVLGRGYNRMEKMGCQTGHAEVIAIQKACKKIGDWRLNGCWMYVTLEPCVMCLGLIQLSRMKGIVFGTRSPLFGFGYGKEKSLPLIKSDLVILEDIKKEACADILQKFFRNIRQRKELM